MQHGDDVRVGRDRRHGVGLVVNCWRPSSPSPPVNSTLIATWRRELLFVQEHVGVAARAQQAHVLVAGQHRRWHRRSRTAHPGHLVGEAHLVGPPTTAPERSERLARWSRTGSLPGSRTVVPLVERRSTTSTLPTLDTHPPGGCPNSFLSRAGQRNQLRQLLAHGPSALGERPMSIGRVRNRSSPWENRKTPSTGLGTDECALRRHVEPADPARQRGRGVRVPLWAVHRMTITAAVRVGSDAEPPAAAAPGPGWPMAARSWDRLMVRPSWSAQVGALADWSVDGGTCTAPADRLESATGREPPSRHRTTLRWRPPPRPPRARPTRRPRSTGTGWRRTGGRSRRPGLHRPRGRRGVRSRVHSRVRSGLGSSAERSSVENWMVALSDAGSGVRAGSGANLTRLIGDDHPSAGRPTRGHRRHSLRPAPSPRPRRRKGRATTGRPPNRPAGSTTESTTEIDHRIDHRNGDLDRSMPIRPSPAAPPGERVGPLSPGGSTSSAPDAPPVHPSGLSEQEES